jgi:putative transposase
LADRLLGGCRFRALTVVDHYSQSTQSNYRARFYPDRHDCGHCSGMGGQASEYLKMITADNGSEFASKAFDGWTHAHGVKLDFILPGNPVEECGD